MFFLDSPVFWGIVGIIGVVVGIIGSYLPNRKVIKYHVTHTNVISSTATKFPGLMVTLDDRPIRNLTITTITFQNVGFQTITSSDIALLEPLGVHISGECFGYIPSSSNSNSALTVTQTRIEDPEGIQGECTLDLDFDFLKRKDDLKVRLWHDGTVSPRGELKFGKLKKDEKDKENLIWCIYMELTYLAGVAFLFSCGPPIISAMIQSRGWPASFSEFEIIQLCACLFFFVWTVLLTVANFEAFHLATK